MSSRGRSQTRNAKRARAVSNSFSSRMSTRSASRSRTTNTRQMWPYQRMGTSQLWDPFPAKATAKMRYSTVITLNPTTGLTASHIFRANGIQDPDQTGIGHQPYGHDTYESIYNHYNVRNSYITMTPTNPRAGIFGCSLTDDSTVQGDYDTVRETKGTRMAVMSDNNSNPPTVTQSFNVNKNFDLPFQKSTSASFGQNPSEAMVFHCWAESDSSSGDGASNNYLITITYTVDMWELKDLGQS